MIRLTITYGTSEVVSGMRTPAFHSGERVTVSPIRQRSGSAGWGILCSHEEDFCWIIMCGMRKECNDNVIHGYVDTVG